MDSNGRTVATSVTGPFPGFPVPLDGRDEREVQGDERRHHRRDDEDVQDVEAALDRPRARVLAVPQQ